MLRFVNSNMVSGWLVGEGRERKDPYVTSGATCYPGGVTYAGSPIMARLRATFGGSGLG